LSAPEIASALARRHREGKLKTADRDRLLIQMERDMGSLYVVEISTEVSALACRLLMKHKLRASDAVHLASALTITGQAGVECQFIGFDVNLNDAAQREGLAVQ
jgi:predicted nucleic acid-binding protein